MEQKRVQSINPVRTKFIFKNTKKQIGNVACSDPTATTITTTTTFVTTTTT